MKFIKGIIIGVGLLILISTIALWKAVKIIYDIIFWPLTLLALCMVAMTWTIYASTLNTPKREELTLFFNERMDQYFKKKRKQFEKREQLVRNKIQAWL